MKTVNVTWLFMLSEGGNLGKGHSFPVTLLLNVKLTHNAGRKLYEWTAERLLNNILIWFFSMLTLANID